MANNPFLNAVENVTDPTDWQDTKLPLLAELDSLKRCYICKEFFRAPLVTSCNHTFCSHCIREYLVNNSKCPLCNVELYESNLRRDILLEEIVSCYEKLRPKLLKALKDEGPTMNMIQSKPDNNEDVVEISPDCEIVTTSSSSCSSSPMKKRKLDDNLVSCPVCNQRMPEEFLQSKHIDKCLQGLPTPMYKPKSKGSSSISSFFKPREREKVPVHRERSPTVELDHSDFYFKQAHKHNIETKKLSKLNYPSLTTPKLKEKLQALKVPTSGTRLQLELRYNHFYVLYNSNLDSSRPVDEKVLRQNLNKWELSHLAFTNNSANLFSSRNSLSNKNILDKNFSVKEWNQVYNKDFKNLIKQAKKSIKQKKEKEGTTAVEEIKPTDDH